MSVHVGELITLLIIAKGDYCKDVNVSKKNSDRLIVHVHAKHHAITPFCSIHLISFFFTLGAPLIIFIGTVDFIYIYFIYIYIYIMMLSDRLI